MISRHNLKKKDPAEFMQVWGRKSIIHVDPAIALAADNPSIMYAFFVGDF
jgi:hypothetical protein